MAPQKMPFVRLILTAFLGSAVTFALTTLLLIPGDIVIRSPADLLPRDETLFALFGNAKELLPLLPAGIPLPGGSRAPMKGGESLAILRSCRDVSPKAQESCPFEGARRSGSMERVSIERRTKVLTEKEDIVRGAFVIHATEEGRRLLAGEGRAPLSSDGLFLALHQEQPVVFLDTNILPKPMGIAERIARTAIGTRVLVSKNGTGWTILSDPLLPRLWESAPQKSGNLLRIQMANPRQKYDAILEELPEDLEAILKGILLMHLQALIGDAVSLEGDLLPLLGEKTELHFLRSGTGQTTIALRGSADPETLTRILARLHVGMRSLLPQTEEEFFAPDPRFPVHMIRMDSSLISETTSSVNGWEIRETVQADSRRGLVSAMRGRDFRLAQNREALDQILQASDFRLPSGLTFIVSGTVDAASLAAMSRSSPLLSLLLAPTMAQMSDRYLLEIAGGNAGVRAALHPARGPLGLRP